MQLKKKNPKDLSFILGCGGTAKGVGQFMGLGVLTLQNMKKSGAIGSAVNKNNTIPGTASIYFANDEAVAALVVELTKMRIDMAKFVKGIHTKSKKLGITFNASNNNPTRRINERKQAPRPRAKR